MPHLFTFNGHGTFSPGGKVTVTAEEAAAINANTDKMELAHWATKPDLFVPAYYVFPELQPQPNIYYSACSCGCNSFGPVLRSAEVRTWGGSPLGHITSARVYSHNFGGRIVSIRVRGTNGADYYGRASWDNGNVIRLRKARS